jgi:hypothetical protein
MLRVELSLRAKRLRADMYSFELDLADRAGKTETDWYPFRDLSVMGIYNS